MRDYVILCDGACDLPLELRERFGIADYLPGNITSPDGTTAVTDMDWKNTTPADFYGSMSKKSIYRTSIRSLATQVEFFEKYLEQGYEILNLSLSTALSGTYANCVNAAKELKDKYPDQRVVCVDTLRYAGAIAILASKAGEMKKAGKTLDEVAKWVEDNKHKIRQIGTVDDLSFLKAMGRITGVAAFMGNLVGIKPLAEVNRKGENQVIAKTKGYNGLYELSVEYIKRMSEDIANQRVVISYTNRKAQALKMKELVEENFHPKEILMLVVGQTCGASIGPGMVNVFFMGPETSEGLVEETKVLNEIMGK
ncbi:MAG: DegV family protein [Butyrivibrio sp.]|nr:DegV family protein [Butyrivibrio sp.]